MSESLEKVEQLLKQLPGLGYRSAERIALHLLVEKPERLEPLVEALRQAAANLRRCPITGNLTEADTCAIYADPARHREVTCVVETVPDLLAIERSGVYRGVYHVLHGKLSPLHGVGPSNLNFASLRRRIEEGEVQELILALSNDIEGEATCHYIQDELLAGRADIRLSRIGFGLPSGGGITYADSATLKSALDGRRDF
ncbi:recombination protein RecR [Ruficoccus amylovorans]|uniref:Recombination protein RecR n=1 Tax=Ruficoccus amylovorans TaxID=1804625 RepID=A0A842HCE4_9BACT|nr:recombination mediator RecR [Ruficoccus amylovorans]MBC2593366.1 recombination protein RecR [Ruficoccus amylovorans]